MFLLGFFPIQNTVNLDFPIKENPLFPQNLHKCTATIEILPYRTLICQQFIRIQ